MVMFEYKCSFKSMGYVQVEILVGKFQLGNESKMSSY